VFIKTEIALFKILFIAEENINKIDTRQKKARKYSLINLGFPAVKNLKIRKNPKYATARFRRSPQKTLSYPLADPGSVSVNISISGCL
jgi:hypothetical protein